MWRSLRQKALTENGSGAEPGSLFLARISFQNKCFPLLLMFPGTPVDMRPCFPDGGGGGV